MDEISVGKTLAFTIKEKPSNHFVGYSERGTRVLIIPFPAVPPPPINLDNLDLIDDPLNPVYEPTRPGFIDIHPERKTPSNPLPRSPIKPSLPRSPRDIVLTELAQFSTQYVPKPSILRQKSLWDCLLHREKYFEPFTLTRFGASIGYVSSFMILFLSGILAFSGHYIIAPIVAFVALLLLSVGLHEIYTRAGREYYAIIKNSLPPDVTHPERLLVRDREYFMEKTWYVYIALQALFMLGLNIFLFLVIPFFLKLLGP